LGGEKFVQYADPKIVKIISSLVKQHEESAEAYNTANRAEQVEDEKFFIRVLNEFLPPKISHDKMITVVDGAIEEIGPDKKNMGKIMKLTKQRIEEMHFFVDGAELSTLVKTKLPI